MMSKQIYWNPVLETLPPEITRKLQLNKFQKILKWTYEHSTFHRRLYDDAGIKPEDIQSFEDIQRIPKVEKSMMRDIQR
ncbi:MAG: phenylacetate--CoA ligase family protein, partial [Deltaproteobacteria bacterium]|nr:phenylacetate--CoA ligase family protein [Deltaproteobacteria bacterium]